MTLLPGTTWVGPGATASPPHRSRAADARPSTVASTRSPGAQVREFLSAFRLRARSPASRMHLAQADRGGGDLDALVLGEELERLLERLSRRGGVSRSVLSDDDVRMLVSFFSRQMLTSMSSEREFSPTIMPS